MNKWLIGIVIIILVIFLVNTFSTSNENPSDVHTSNATSDVVPDEFCMGKAMSLYGGPEQIAMNPQEFENSPERRVCFLIPYAYADEVDVDFDERSSPDLLDTCLTAIEDSFGGFEVVSTNPPEYINSPERAFCYFLWFGEDYEDYL